jgi:hypothetical protein
MTLGFRIENLDQLVYADEGVAFRADFAFVHSALGSSAQLRDTLDVEVFRGLLRPLLAVFLEDLNRKVQVEQLKRFKMRNLEVRLMVAKNV